MVCKMNRRLIAIADAIDFLGTEDATTCHIIILRHTGKITVVYVYFAFRVSVKKLFIDKYLCAPLLPSAKFSVYLSVCLSICLSVSIYLSIYLTVPPSVPPSLLCPPPSPSLSLCLSFSPSLSLFLSRPPSLTHLDIYNIPVTKQYSTISL